MNFSTHMHTHTLKMHHTQTHIFFFTCLLNYIQLQRSGPMKIIQLKPSSTVSQVTNTVLWNHLTANCFITQ